MKHFKPTELALIISALFAAPMVMAQTAAPTDVGKVSVEGQGGTGLITQEETPKARSSISRERLEQMTPSSNPYQAIELLPGVNTFSQDATGLFGGGMRVRGANSDQMGFTINGAPVNDSGSFTVFPQEYADQENLCEIFVTQGATDSEAPHVGASGGNIGMVTCPPLDDFRFRFAQSVGNLNFSKTYLRLDSGKFANDMAKVFISYSKSRVDKFKGSGGADRDHWDIGAEFKPTADLTLSTSLLYNSSVTNNFRTLTKAQIAASGSSLDFSNAPPQHLAAVGGVAQTEVAPADGYYKYNVNPFLDYLWTGKVAYKLNKDISFSAEPYFWYGFGTGGSQLTTLKESKSAGILGGGVKDINGDGDTLDTVMVYGSNVTRTLRPGITLKSNMQFDNQNVLVGFWIERARHYQSGPRVVFDNSGASADTWLSDNSIFLQRQDGTPVMGRDQLTISSANSLFLQDSINLMQDKLNVQLGIRNSEIRREFTNYANENSTSTTGRTDADYRVDKTYSKALGSVGVRYNLDAQQHIFTNVAQNFKAPGNFSYNNLLIGGTVTNGVLSGYTQRDPSVVPETSTNFDFGYRYQGDNLTLSTSVYYIDFQNRISSAYDPVTNLKTDYNVGAVQTKGLEFEAGYKLNSNWSLYGSVSYTSSIMQDDLRTAATTYEATSGKQLPDTPNWLGGLSLSYTDGGWFGSIQAKYTGPSFSTLVNDEQVDGVTLVNANIGYKFASAGFFKNPQIQFNVSNLFNEQYLRINSGSGSQFTVRAQGAGGVAPAYYVGAPRFSAVTLRSDF
jgi:iron complex outermembrane receptor protein